MYRQDLTGFREIVEILVYARDLAQSVAVEPVTVGGAIMKSYVPSLTGKNLIELLGQKAAGLLLDINHAASSDIEHELTITAPNGDQKIIGYSVVAREDATGHQVGRIISINDLSELKYVRKEMEKMNRLATIAEIASAVAHEVRNPLAGIKIMAQSIEGQSVSKEEQNECLRRIVRQVDRLNSLLTEFFSYARPATAQVRKMSLQEIISETRPLIANKLMKSHIIFRENHQENLPSIIADPNQVQQVLLNLFLNAIDAILQGYFGIWLWRVVFSKKKRAAYRNACGHCQLCDLPFGC